MGGFERMRIAADRLPTLAIVPSRPLVLWLQKWPVKRRSPLARSSLRASTLRVVRASLAISTMHAYVSLMISRACIWQVRKMRRGEFDEFYDNDLREAFERFGTLLRAEITLDKDTGVSKGFGFVSYTDAAAADAAMAAMNGAMVAGRQIRIEKTAEDH